MLIFTKWPCLLSVVLLSCLGLLSCADGHKPLDPDEKRTLQQVATTMEAEHLNLGSRNCEFFDAKTDSSITCQACNATFCHISELILKSYSLKGRIPREIANLEYLEKIDLTRTNLTGSLPIEWTRLKYLTFISLTANRLSGQIPKEWGKFANLTYLSLEANNLSGPVPDELGNLVNLTDLILSSNKFVGSLPKTLVSLKNLTNLRLTDNNFEGSVPEFIGSLTKLQRLDMQATGMKGPIPVDIFRSLGNLNDLRMSDMEGEKSNFPNFNDTSKLKHLILRNVNLFGSIPTVIWQVQKMQKMLDLSFNNLEGELPDRFNPVKFTFLGGNRLSGSVPDAFLVNRENNFVDLSYNNFTWLDTLCNQSSGLETVNTYRSSPLKSQKGLLLPCTPTLNCQTHRKSSLHINCGGPSVTVKNAYGSLLYEGDMTDGYLGAKSYAESYWGFSSTGDFMDDDDTTISHIVKEKDHQFGDSELLYTTARSSPLSLTYFACLENGMFTVKLHFAEIIFGTSYSGMGRRLFDIYIQGNIMSKDFNIEEEANRTGSKAVVMPYSNVSVVDNTLDIRFYWAGKGTTVVPKRGSYGILISAISVCPSSKSPCEEHKKRSFVAGIMASVLCLIFLVTGVLAWRRYCRNKYKRERSAGGLFHFND